MNSLNNRETERLRTTDLMIAYIRDEAPLEDVIQVESLMEEDPIYRLSIEHLANSLDENPVRARQHDAQMQTVFPGLLAQAKEAFVLELESNPEPRNTSGRSTWFTYVLALFILVAIPIIWWQYSTPSEVVLHTDASTFLIPEGDRSQITQFVDNCGSKLIGRPAQGNTSIVTAMYDQFANGHYQASAQQLAQIRQEGRLADECEVLANFYLAESHTGLQQWVQAKSSFKLVTEHPKAPLPVLYASHWYLANLALLEKDYETAVPHLQELSKVDPANTYHLQSLLDIQYLDIAKRYLDDIEGP